MLNWQKSKVIGIEVITDTTSLFRVEILDAETLEFTPGQFITFDLPIHEKRNKRLRSYSIASPPNETNIVDLIIGKLPDGLASSFLFDKSRCDVGTILNFRGPVGVFTEPEDLDKHNIFVCTGTGVAPFRSMLFNILNNKKPFKSIDLVFGARTINDILYRQELEDIAKEYDNFNYHICLSREEFQGYKGYVHSRYQEVAERYEKEAVQFMFCGWREMIDQAREELSVLNYTKDQINFELYG